MAILEGIKEFISIKIKPRNDDMIDQINRLIKPKIFMIVAVLFISYWFTDKIHCPTAKFVESSVDAGYIHGTCWYKGFYVYEDVFRKYQGMSAYYGIPTELDYDGIDDNEEICKTSDKKTVKKSECKPMKKTHYTQHVWLPLLILFMAPISYIPYLFYKKFYYDINRVKSYIRKTEHPDPKLIYDEFFCESTEGKDFYIIAGGMIVKILYIVSAIVEFIILDICLKGKFISYGTKWMEWLKTDYNVYDIKTMSMPFPGDEILPAQGLCGLDTLISHELVKRVATEQIYSCELSPFVLYQYGLLVLWFFIVVSIVMSCISFLLHLYSTIYMIMNRNKPVSKYYYTNHMLTIRELILLISAKNVSLKFGKQLAITIDKMKKGHYRKNTDETEIMI